MRLFIHTCVMLLVLGFVGVAVVFCLIGADVPQTQRDKDLALAFFCGFLAMGAVSLLGLIFAMVGHILARIPTKKLS